MAYYALEILNDNGTKLLRREIFNTKKAALKAHHRAVNGRIDPRHPRGIKTKVIARVLYYPS